MDVLQLTKHEFHLRLKAHIEKIYGARIAEELVKKILAIFWDVQPAEEILEAGKENRRWDESDICLITYGNSILSDSQNPLCTLLGFLQKYANGMIKLVHVLPFFPYCSDDGFAVIDYKKVNPALGTWQDIKNMSQQFDLMVDLVINHVSAQSQWFKQFKQAEKPGCDYFMEIKSGDDISSVVRPRMSDLRQKVNTVQGEKYVWCTFSANQVDLNFSNPDVLLEFMEILRFYIEQGIRTIRLDAIAFLWKKLGTPCINLPETHEIIKVFRLIVERYYPKVLFITETNIPNIENLKYLGNSNEAHIIYNFSLPPLLLHALWSGDASHLTQWSMSLPPAPMGCTYLNFTASHDGIGLRPVEGMIADSEIDTLVHSMKNFGGEVTSRAISKTGERPYEINITWMDAMKGTSRGMDDYHMDRFLCSQTIMLGLEGIPAFYIHSLLAGENDYEKFATTQEKRSINRRQWNLDELDSILNDPSSKSCKVFNSLKRLIAIRSKQPAFHPDATQYVLHLGTNIFGVWRQSINREQSIFAIHNISSATQELLLGNINLICTDTWVDLIAQSTLDQSCEAIELSPYQCLWISNKV